MEVQTRITTSIYNYLVVDNLRPDDLLAVDEYIILFLYIFKYTH